MAAPGSRIPAWKRLGLQLKHDGQSEDAAAVDQSLNVKSGQREPSRVIEYNQVFGDTHENLTQNSKSSTLGKRKHEDEPAEVPNASSKKRKPSEVFAQQNGNTAESRLTTTVEVNGTGNQVAETRPEAKQGTPKGDPNYRKKKAGKKSWQSRDSHQFNTESSTDNINEARDHGAPSPPNGETHGSLAVSTETTLDMPLDTTALRKTKLAKALRENGVNETPVRSTPPALLRRKSVTFTPDTKTVDGNSASNLFKAWFAEQKQAGAEFTSADVEQFVPPPKVHPANDLPAPSPTQAKEKGEKKTKKSKKAGEKEGSERVGSAIVPGAPSDSVTTSQEKDLSAGKPEGNRKKDSSYYLSYLSEYHNSRSTWKFNKAKQAELLKNALNVFRIPAEHEEALIAYIKGLQGAGARDRLAQACRDTIDDKDTDNQPTMDDPEVRKAAEEEAGKQRVEKQKKRRRMEADMEGLADAPDPDEFLRKIKKKRASALLGALSASAPLPTVVAPKPVAQPFVARKTPHKTIFEDEPTTSATKSKPRNRKSRTAAIDDHSDSSSSSSSDSSSSDDSSSSSEESADSDSDDSDSDSDSDSSSNSSGSVGSSSDSDSSVASQHKERGPSIDKISTSANDGSSSSSSDSSSDSDDSDSESEKDSDVKIKKEKVIEKKSVKGKKDGKAASVRVTKTEVKSNIKPEPTSSDESSSSTKDSGSESSSSSDDDSDDDGDKDSDKESGSSSSSKKSSGSSSSSKKSSGSSPSSKKSSGSSSSSKKSSGSSSSSKKSGSGSGSESDDEGGSSSSSGSESDDEGSDGDSDSS